jgi:hypothetical protein
MKEHEYVKEQEREVERMWAEMTKKEYEAKVRKKYLSNMRTSCVYIYIYIYI